MVGRCRRPSEHVTNFLLMAHFDSTLSQTQIQLDEDKDVDVEFNFAKVAFRSREVEKLLNALDTNGGSDPLGMFPLFLKGPMQFFFYHCN